MTDALIKALCYLLFAHTAAPIQQVTAPLLLEGNAPIVELEFPTASGGVRKARFFVDTVGSKLMADVGAKPSGDVLLGRITRVEVAVGHFDFESPRDNSRMVGNTEVMCESDSQIVSTKNRLGAVHSAAQVPC